MTGDGRVAGVTRYTFAPGPLDDVDGGPLATSARGHPSSIRSSRAKLTLTPSRVRVRGVGA
jgi:hypothetical protein